MKVFLNTKIVDEREAVVSVFDHGFLYGDGVYETVYARGYRLIDWPAHARRLKNALAEIDLSCPWTGASLERAIIRVLRANRQPDASARVTISRGAGPLGLEPTTCGSPTLAIMLHLPRSLKELRANGVSAAMSTVLHGSRLTHLKSNNALSAVLAKAEATRWGAFEAIRFNAQGHLTEGTTTNVFWVRRGQLYTPSLACGILDGITRRHVLRLARRARLATHEGVYRKSDVRNADELFLTNSTFNILPVIAVLSAKGKRQRMGDGTPGPLTRRLQQLFISTPHGLGRLVPSRASE